MRAIRRAQRKVRLRLYIAGNAPNSLQALANVRTLLDQHLGSSHELEIVDLLKHPRRGLTDGIIVTPTLLRLLPLPVERLIGNLSDSQKVLLTLVGR